MTAAFYTAVEIRKNAWNTHTDRQRTENSITEATLIPCGLSGGAGQFRMIAWLLANS